jgi:ABC-type multidrug transport system fused ATPase/permease subunit
VRHGTTTHGGAERRRRRQWRLELVVVDVVEQRRVDGASGCARGQHERARRRRGASARRPYLERHRKPLLVGLACLLLRTLFSVASPWVLRYAIDDLTLGVTRDKLVAYAALVVGVVTVEGFFLYQMRMILIGASREIEYELRGDLFSHFTRLPARYYHSMRTGDLMSRATSDLSAVRMVLGPGIMYTASTVATFVGTIALMATISPWLLALSLVPLCFSTGFKASSRRCDGSRP